ncbi:hypothetical protein BJY16_007272 [Actinoplanes octamycinicus]|uniref:NACHT domain-containing protein n=1 Tax=Actinoplanes octamycinicus TaxID=135948 RepID=A0A7W7H4K6_9ACTN|nr:HEAT repeat domain-containing protein [Actinoplanes octamycinicus]MBB4743813.1 hypothetical protein [Actinoplanes octamycinicus]GIE58441.1 hypothetical protein Aoc01nite_38430 [Actinoplanes octamycinicus]
MSLADATWLSVADKAGSIVGASAGIASLILSVLAARQQRQAPPATRTRSDLWSLSVSVLLPASLAVAVSWAGPRAAARLGLPRLYPPMIGFVLGLVAFAALIRWLVRWSRAPAASTDINALLTAQLSAARDQMYDLTGTAADPLHVYVRQLVRGAADAGEPRIRAETMISRHRHVVLTAGPGGGKSTLAARLVVDTSSWWLNAPRWRTRIGPPYDGVVALRAPATSLVTASLEESLGLPDPVASPHGLLTRPPFPGAAWLVCVDGIDEIVDPRERARVLRLLSHEVSSRPRWVRFLITSRSLPPGELPPLVESGARQFHLEEFDPEGLGLFAKAWFAHQAPSDASKAETAGEASRFLSRIEAAGLGGLARNPLMATMAATIYQNDRGADLPTDRTDLYRAFIRVLRRARSIPLDRMPAGPRPVSATSELTAFAARVDGRIDELLVVSASATVSSGRLNPLAQAVVRAESACTPKILSGTTRFDRLNTLRQRLIATSLTVPQSVGIAFIHRSIAEYLAADPAGGAFDEVRWRLDFADPARRSYALFCLARRANDISGVVARLLTGAAADPVGAGRILADGMAVQPEVEKAVADALLTRTRHDHETTADCLAVLLGIATARPWLRRRLEELLDDRTEPLAFRCKLAAVLFDQEPVRHRRTIRELSVEALQSVDARAYLIGRVEKLDPEFAVFMLRRLPRPRTATVSMPAPANVRQLMAHCALHGTELHARFEAALVSLGEPGVREALDEMLQTGALTPTERMQAAAALDIGDSRLTMAVHRDTLHDVRASTSERRIAAQALSVYGDEDAIQVLHQIALAGNCRPIDRFDAIDALERLQDPLAFLALERMTTDPGLKKLDRREAERRLVARRAEVTPAPTQVAARTPASSPAEEIFRRLEKAWVLARSKSDEGAETIRTIAADRDLPTACRTTAADMLIRLGDTTAGPVLRDIVLTDYYSDEVRIEAAAALLFLDDKLGRQTLRAANDPRPPRPRRRERLQPRRRNGRRRPMLDGL